MLERSGYGEDIAAFDAAHGDAAGMRAAISDGFLDALTAIGEEPAVRAGVDRYVEAGVTLPCVGPDPDDRLRGDAARGGAMTMPHTPPDMRAPS